MTNIQIYSAWHSRIARIGSKWYWAVTDFAGVIMANGKTQKRSEAREEMGKTMKKLRKQ